MSKASLPLLITILFKSATACLAIEEVEPNDTLATATNVIGEFTITGSFDEGTNEDDIFLVENVTDFPYRLEAEARILSGPAAGAEDFRFQFFDIGVAMLDPNSFPTGNGSRMLVTANHPVPPLADAYLLISYPPTAPAGRYVITYRFVRIDKESPNLRIRSLRKLSGDRVRAKIYASAGGLNYMKSLRSRASANRLETVLATTVPYLRPSGELGAKTNTRSLEATYTFKLRRPVTRLLITAENTSGFNSIVVERIRKPRNEQRKRPGNPRL